MNARLPTHNDLPTFACHLGREVLVEQVAREIAEGEPPLVLGIHGDWGSGKTSFLYQLAHELSEDCLVPLPDRPSERKLADIDNVFTVWFEAWRYQHEPAPVVALLQEMCRQLPLHRKIGEVVKKWGEVITKGFFGAIDELSLEIQSLPFGIGGKGALKIKNPVHKIHEAAEQWESEHLGSRLTTDHVRRLLTDAIERLLGGEDAHNRRVCIIIDDLDRCAPSVALKLLEGIKIHLSLPRCVFVLGVNVLQLQRALAPELPGAKEKTNIAEQRAEAAEYLEKLCTFTWKLPFPTAGERAALLDRWLQDPPRCDPERTVRLPPALRERIAEVAAQFDCLPANPRKLKGLANTIRHLAARVWTVTNQQREFDLPAPKLRAAADVLLIAGSIDQFHPELLRYLQTYYKAWEELVKWVTGKSTLPVYSDFARLLQELQRSAVPDAIAQTAATIGSSPLTPIYPDPSHLSVFRIHGLMREATSAPRNTVTRQSIAPFLKLPLSIPGMPEPASTSTEPAVMEADEPAQEQTPSP